MRGETFWNFAANDYLGLAEDSRLAAAASGAMNDHGLGARASPLVTGRTHWHVRLEQSLAALKQTEAAILFPSGYAANLGTVPALVGAEDVIYCDRLNHASLIDGCRLSRARFRVYPHRDLSTLRQELEKGNTFRRRLIVTDSLFSMDGDHAPLRQLVDLAEEFNAMLLVDEAHATGIYGPRGGGLLEQQEIHSPNVIAMGTLSKAIGLQGGFVAGPAELIAWLWNAARTQVFSTALPIPVCAAALQAIELIHGEPERRTQLLEKSAHVQEELRCQGWTIPQAVAGPILPIIVGEAGRALVLADELEKQEILVAAIRPPTVPPQTARLRISLNAAHSEEGIERLLQALRGLR